MQEIVYFAYGSNMSSRRLRYRVPNARVIGRGVLSGYRLAWHKQGSDGSGKCDIVAAHPAEVVYGVLYRLSPEHKPRLDRAEGLGHSYAQCQVEARLLDEEDSVSAVTYYALKIDPTYLPFSWYRDHVLIGAREHGLPDHYIAMIENVPVFEDPDRGRERAERRVHEGTVDPS